MVTKIEDLKKYAEGVEVGIPGFDAGEVITFKLKRPSLIDMARNGKIPNPLMDTAVKLFKDGLSDAGFDGFPHVGRVGAKRHYPNGCTVDVYLQLHGYGGGRP